MKTFDEAWKDLGYNYGEDERESVKLGWELCLKELNKVIDTELSRIVKENHNIKITNDVKKAHEMIDKMKAEGKDIPFWMYPCCDKEDRDINGECRNCGSPCL